MRGHIKLEEIKKYRKGQLSEEEKDLLFEHLAACDRCRNIFSQVMLSLSDEQIEIVTPTPIWKRRGIYKIATAVAIILAVVQTPIIIGLYKENYRLHKMVEDTVKIQVHPVRHIQGDTLRFLRNVPSGVDTFTVDTVIEQLIK